MAKKNLVYNLTQAVGAYCANEPHDVMLVRFFLRRISEVPSMNSPYRSLPITGVFDKTLGDAILWFQRTAREKGKKITVDGRVDPAPKGDGYYTILFMNGNYWKYFPEYRMSYEKDPLFPASLAEHMNAMMPLYL